MSLLLKVLPQCRALHTQVQGRWEIWSRQAGETKVVHGHTGNRHFTEEMVHTMPVAAEICAQMCESHCRACMHQAWRESRRLSNCIASVRGALQRFYMRRFGCSGSTARGMQALPDP
jgi:hypothetical protein